MWLCLQGLVDAFGIVRNDGEVGAGGLIRFATPLFLIAERAKGNMIAGGKCLLRQAAGSAQGLGAWRALHAGQVGVRQEPCIGIAQGRLP